jgi:hypothetical protein
MTPLSSNPFEGEPRKPAPGLSPMETMGVLTVRLIHDLSNQLTILAGNAQVLELVRNNPERLSKVIDRIKTSSTNAGELIDRFARFRQEMRFRTTPHPLAECVRSLDTLNPLGGGWTTDVRGELTEQVSLEPRWVAFSIWQIALLCGSPRGHVTLTQGDFPADWPSPAYVPTRLKEKQLLRCELGWQGPGPWLEEKEAAKPTDLSLAAAYEIFKIVDGWSHYQFLPGEEHRFNLFIPLST